MTEADLSPLLSKPTPTKEKRKRTRKRRTRRIIKRVKEGDEKEKSKGTGECGR